MLVVSDWTWVWYASGFSLHVGMVCKWFLIGRGYGMLVVSHCTWVWYASGFSLHVGMVC